MATSCRVVSLFQALLEQLHGPGPFLTAVKQDHAQAILEAWLVGLAQPRAGQGLFQVFLGLAVMAAGLSRRDFIAKTPVQRADEEMGLGGQAWKALGLGEQFRDL